MLRQRHQHLSALSLRQQIWRSEAFAGLPMQTTVGVQTRYDDIALALSDTYQRSFLSTVRNDRVGEGSARGAGHKPCVVI